MFFKLIIGKTEFIIRLAYILVLAHWKKYHGSRRHMRNKSDEVIFFLCLQSALLFVSKAKTSLAGKDMMTTIANSQTQVFLYRILRPTETPFVRRNFPMFTCKKKKRRTSPFSPSDGRTLRVTEREDVQKRKKNPMR